MGDSGGIRTHASGETSEWNAEKSVALAIIKKKLTMAPMRTLVNFKSSLRIYVDASETGFSVALFQLSKESSFMEIVAFFNKNMSKIPSWRNKDPYQRELFGAAAAITKFEFLLRGYHDVILFTDNKAVSQSSRSRSFVIRNLFDRIAVEFPNLKILHIPAH